MNGLKYRYSERKRRISDYLSNFEILRLRLRMTKRIHAALIVIIFFLNISFIVPASFADQFVIDPVYTTFMFRIKHLMGYASGTIPKYDGTIDLNQDNKAFVGMNITLDLASMDTKNKDRDEDLRSERFFDVAKFPQGKFVTKKVQADDKVIGDLTLKGVTKEVTLAYVFHGIAKDQFGRTKTALTLKGTINRKDFGISYNTKTDDGKWLLGDDVDLWIEIQGILDKDKDIKRTDVRN